MEDLWLYVAVGVGLIVLLSLILTWPSSKKKNKLPKSGPDQELNEVIARLEKKLNILAERQVKIKEQLDRQAGQLRKSVTHCKIKRFNPFPGQGGNHSFSAAWLDQKGDGLVISGLYTRDKVNVYAKPITDHSSVHELTEEESAVISKTNPEKK